VALRPGAWNWWLGFGGRRKITRSPFLLSDGGVSVGLRRLSPAAISHDRCHHSVQGDLGRSRPVVGPTGHGVALLAFRGVPVEGRRWRSLR